MASGIEYIKAFRAEARQLRDIKNGLGFFRMDLPISEAVAWANAGSTAPEAQFLRELGIATAKDAAGYRNDEIFSALLGRLDDDE